ncbi:BTAD domain-containing putative transcriptional regulator [Streptomyces sp. NRRL B-1677]|uniref:AfsR/SARP family transcriptional regulator n=1 Tax=Streptomyces sp. NRRL B-1677 TaxID=2682966 RepID=UPI003A7F1ADC
MRPPSPPRPAHPADTAAPEPGSGRHRAGPAHPHRPRQCTIEVAPCRLDLGRFAELTRLARAAGDCGDPAGEADLLTEALALWHGQPFADIESESLHREVTPRLRESWITAGERYHDVCLSLGRHDQIVGELRALTHKYPFHERRWIQLMTALHRCGRRGEALQAYAAMRRSLRDEPGVEPGEEARQLHLAMLRSGENIIPERDAAPANGREALRERDQQRASWPYRRQAPRSPPVPLPASPVLPGRPAGPGRSAPRTRRPPPRSAAGPPPRGVAAEPAGAGRPRPHSRPRLPQMPTPRRLPGCTGPCCGKAAPRRRPRGAGRPRPGC